jgi:hypothetical protein
MLPLATTTCTRCILSPSTLTTRSLTFMSMVITRLMCLVRLRLARRCIHTHSEAELIRRSCKGPRVVQIRLASALSVSLDPVGRVSNASKSRQQHVPNAGLLMQRPAFLVFKLMANLFARSATSLQLQDQRLHLLLQRPRAHQTPVPHIQNARLRD